MKGWLNGPALDQCQGTHIVAWAYAGHCERGGDEWINAIERRQPRKLALRMELTYGLAFSSKLRMEDFDQE